MPETPNTSSPSGLSESPAETVLQSLLAAYQLQARLTDRISLCGSWDEPEPEAPHAWFHLVESGVCYIRATCLQEPVRLAAGDLIVFPEGAAHHLCSAERPEADTVFAKQWVREASARPAPAPTLRGTVSRAEADTGGAACVLLCGEFHFGGTLAAPLLACLPPSIHLSSAAGEGSLAGLATMLRAEAANERFGSRAVMNKLSDALFVIALRHHMQHNPGDHGLLAALSDPRIAPALALIHARPGEGWTVEALADHVHLSRAAFAQRFTDLLGEPPMRYLTRWRMTEAARLLQDPRASVSRIAAEVGFETEAAFRRAFKRVHGSGPGALRRASRAA